MLRNRPVRKTVFRKTNLRKSIFRKTLFIAASTVCGIILLSSCRLPNRPGPGESPDLAERTQIAQTLIAQLTLIASPLPANLPSETPVPAGQPAPTTAGGMPGEGTPPGGSPAGSLTPEDPIEIGASPTIQPTPASTALPTHTEEPTPTTVAGDPRESLGEPHWRDPFETGENWALYEDEFAGFEVENGTLVANSKGIGPRNAWMLAWPHLENFYIELTARPGECQGKDRYGLMARSPDASQGYLFGFSCDGQYGMYKWNGERLLKIVDWTSAPSIAAGAQQTNRLGFRAVGSRFSLYANGVLLAEVNDAGYREGGFGVFIGAEATAGFTARFSEVSYWVLP